VKLTQAHVYRYHVAVVLLAYRVLLLWYRIRYIPQAVSLQLFVPHPGCCSALSSGRLIAHVSMRRTGDVLGATIQWLGLNSRSAVPSRRASLSDRLFPPHSEP
jgi:hypothetical protein